MSYVAGRVGLIPKGEYSATTQYNKLDIVTYNNKGYIAKVNNIPVGTLPTNSNYFLESFSLSGYATTSEVNSLIESALTDYSTTEETQNLIDDTIAPLTNYKPTEAVEVGKLGNKTVYRLGVEVHIGLSEYRYTNQVIYRMQLPNGATLLSSKLTLLMETESLKASIPIPCISWGYDDSNNRYFQYSAIINALLLPFVYIIIDDTNNMFSDNSAMGKTVYLRGYIEYYI